MHTHDTLPGLAVPESLPRLSRNAHLTYVPIRSAPFVCPEPRGPHFGRDVCKLSTLPGDSTRHYFGLPRHLFGTLPASKRNNGSTTTAARSALERTRENGVKAYSNISPFVPSYRQRYRNVILASIYI